MEEYRIVKTKLPRKLKKRYKKERKLHLTIIHKPICNIESIKVDITV